MMLVILAAVWLLAALAVLGVCRSAASGDRTEILMSEDSALRTGAGSF